MNLIPASLLMISSLVLLMVSASSAGVAFCNFRFIWSFSCFKDHPGGDIPLLGSTLELRNVTFCYPEAVAPVICDLNLRIEPGETVGICGDTGSGKNTLIKLITGIEEPSSGRIYYGGIDLQRCNPHTLMRRIACGQGEDICILDHKSAASKTNRGNSCIVFSSREEALAGCDRVLYLSNGSLVQRL